MPVEVYLSGTRLILKIPYIKIGAREWAKKQGFHYDPKNKSWELDLKKLPESKQREIFEKLMNEITIRFDHSAIDAIKSIFWDSELKGRCIKLISGKTYQF